MIGLVDEFFARTGSPTQAQIDWLKRHGAAGMTLIRDGDGDGFPLGVARVERVGRHFGFRDEDGAGAFVFVARDEDGEPADLVAWEPRTNWVAPLNGWVALLGQHEVLAPRMGGPLAVHRDALGWLRGDRAGVVILNKARARLLLEGQTLEAEDVEHGHELRRILAAPEPRIVVPTAAIRRAA